jgi:hypothetical protein
MKSFASFGLLLNLRPNPRRRDRTVETIQSIDMALMGISGRAVHGKITCSSATYISIFNRLTLNYSPSGMEL